MKTLKTMTANGRTVAVFCSETSVITDTRSALDVMMAARYEKETNLLAIRKEALTEDFFILSTGLAGEILQKFVNYGMKCAVFGDFSHYTSKPLRDFIRESNRGMTVFFTDTAETAASRLTE